MSEEFNELPIRCRGVAVVLLKEIEQEYRVLLLKRTTSVLRGEWCYIGGAIEKGEKAWEAAFREVEEETGVTKVDLYVSNKFDQFYSPMEEYIYIAPVFVGFVDSAQSITLNDEHSEFQWLTFHEAKEQASLPGNMEVLEFVERHFVQRKPLEWLRISK